jgi:phospholipid/cholesterol/gamma-HCH transport system ATP-binding protein
VIRIEGLTKSFGANRVLRGVDLDVPKATITIIIGRSGGGKSVLLKHLIGLMRPDAGRVLVDGLDITQLSGRALEPVRRRYGVVFQSGALFDSLTCWDNVAFPLRETTRLSAAEVRARVEAALEQVELAGVGPKLSLILFSEPTRH